VQYLNIQLEVIFLFIAYCQIVTSGHRAPPSLFIAAFLNAAREKLPLWTLGLVRYIPPPPGKSASPTTVFKSPVVSPKFFREPTLC
jgi:hypothetical protein